MPLSRVRAILPDVGRRHIRLARIPELGAPREREVVIPKRMLQSMAFRSFLPLLALAMLFGCGPATPPRTPRPTPPMPTPTIPADGDDVVAGLREALGPESPMRIRATANVRIGNLPLKTAITEGDFQGNEMDATVSIRDAVFQLSFEVIAADGNAYIRQPAGKWTRSSEKVPKKGSGPFGDIAKATLKFAGAATSDRRLYTVVWKNAADTDRLLRGTILTKVKIKSSELRFDVRSTGDPVSARFSIDGSGRYAGKTLKFEMSGIYTFFSIHEPLVFKAPIK